MPARKPDPTLDGYLLTATQDAPDGRDWIYEPALVQLRSSIPKPRTLHVLDQGKEGACTGFGLAAAINLLNQRRRRNVRVSPRMLYEMARRFDEWPGEQYAGSSCRGAIRGWAGMGVCRDSLWPYRADKPGTLSIKAAKDARENTIGAYYRLEPRIADFHAALNEAGVVFCSAHVHEGWQGEAVHEGVIPYPGERAGGHAFALVGYGRRGFWVQNSWGKDWGRSGLALWSYEDWNENLIDAWVFRLALPTPQIWHLASGLGRDASQAAVSPRSTLRSLIAGHFVHVDDGHFHDAGRYWSNQADVDQTAELLAKSRKYDHLLIYAHGGLNSPSASARRIAAMKEVYKANRIYPFHIMYDTGIMEELKDVILRRREEVQARAAGLVDWWDRILERLSRIPGRALWREMKQGARAPFVAAHAGTEVLRSFLGALRTTTGPRLKLHLVGHSTGAILQAHLLDALEELAPGLRVSSCSLLAPAATVDLYRSHYRPLLSTTAGTFGVDSLKIYNLTDRLEQQDSVGPYRKSLLYFVSRSFEEDTPKALLGMARYSDELEATPGLEVIYSQGDPERERRSASRTHGGFDNDPHTMNAVLRTVLGAEPVRPFTDEDLA